MLVLVLVISVLCLVMVCVIVCVMFCCVVCGVKLGSLWVNGLLVLSSVLMLLGVVLLGLIIW